MLDCEPVPVRFCWLFLSLCWIHLNHVSLLNLCLIFAEDCWAVDPFTLDVHRCIIGSVSSRRARSTIRQKSARLSRSMAASARRQRDTLGARSCSDQRKPGSLVKFFLRKRTFTLAMSAGSCEQAPLSVNWLRCTHLPALSHITRSTAQTAQQAPMRCSAWQGSARQEVKAHLPTPELCLVCVGRRL